MRWRVRSTGLFHYFELDTGEMQKITYPHYLALLDVLSGEIDESECKKRKAEYELSERKKHDRQNGILEI